MTLTQVSTWFANARRRLKKENKWSPDGSCDDGSDAGDSSSLPDSAAQSSASRLPSTQPSTLPDESGYSSKPFKDESESNMKFTKSLLAKRKGKGVCLKLNLKILNN